jgi:hypothetical protein
MRIEGGSQRMTIRTGTALAILALLTAPDSGPRLEETAGSAADPVLAEMAPAPGRWEVEDAPAYFSEPQAIMDAPARGEPVANGDHALGAEPREGEALVARRRP